MRLGQLDFEMAADLLKQYGLCLHAVDDDAPIPGSFWGDEEAGIIGPNVYARMDTPVHSLLHEASHLIVLPAERRSKVHTDATDSVEEEDAACYLQIVLADQLAGVGQAQLMDDMDTWGYTFRLGSSRAWFEGDAGDARRWLIDRQLLTAEGGWLPPKREPGDDVSRSSVPGDIRTVAPSTGSPCHDSAPASA
jgi:hypothetical protein